MPKIVLKDFTMHYELSGKPHAPVLLLSSSLGTSLEMWEPQMQAFEQHYQILRYDMRGHGRSSTPQGPYSIEALGVDVVGLLHGLQIDTVDFCGLSIGGLIGQWLGIYWPLVVNQLVLCNTAASIGSRDSWNQRIAIVQQHGMDGIAEGVLQRWFTEGFRKQGSPLLREMEDMLRSTDSAGYIATCAALREADLREGVRGIKCPVCIIAGTEDLATTLADSKYLETEIAQSMLQTIPAAHISSIEAPLLFNGTVLDFLLSPNASLGNARVYTAGDER